MMLKNFKKKIILIDDYGDTFYIILRGSIDIFKNIQYRSNN